MPTKNQLSPIVIRGKSYEDRGYCRTPHGGIYSDGPVIHTVYCRRDHSDTATSGSDCIRERDDGAQIAADREAAADKARFTPPEYLDHGTEPGPVITFDRRQPLERLVLRGRPRVPGAEWTTWEVYTDRGDGTFWGDIERMANAPRPPAMTQEQTATIVSEFSSRVPTHEFKIVRARIVVTEEQIA